MSIEWKGVSGTVTGVQTVWQKGRVGYTVGFTYTVGGVPYSGEFNTWNAYSEGDSIAVRYDTNDPHRNKLVRGDKIKQAIAYSVFAVVVVIGLVFLLAIVPGK